ncbi:MAG TPA: guanylate kinase [Marmoricola sp.]|nr:guanylate kinase [Marmoricola sp.]
MSEAAEPSGPARLTVLAGPTAVGKGTLTAWIREHHPEIWISVSATTRRRRPGEVDGVHYHFVSEEEFDRLITDDELLEWAVVHQGARYGTPRAPVLAALAEQRPALLEIDLQGARQVRERMPEARFVFLAPPSWEELVRRLVGRGTEDEAERERRLATAREELAAEAEFDVTVVNRTIHDAGEELVELTRSGSRR